MQTAKYAAKNDIDTEPAFNYWVPHALKKRATFPQTKLHVGRWLGPAADLGYALTYKIFKNNAQLVPRSTMRHLTLDKFTKPDHIAMRKSFDDNIIQKIGVPATENDFDKDYLTLTYGYYDDDHQDGTTDTPPEQLIPTPEIGDNYLARTCC